MNRCSDANIKSCFLVCSKFLRLSGGILQIWWSSLMSSALQWVRALTSPVRNVQPGFLDAAHVSACCRVGRQSNNPDPVLLLTAWGFPSKSSNIVLSPSFLQPWWDSQFQQSHSMILPPPCLTVIFSQTPCGFSIHNLCPDCPWTHLFAVLFCTELYWCFSGCSRNFGHISHFFSFLCQTCSVLFVSLWVSWRHVSLHFLTLGNSLITLDFLLLLCERQPFRFLKSKLFSFAFGMRLSQVTAQSLNETFIVDWLNTSESTWFHSSGLRFG